MSEDQPLGNAPGWKDDDQKVRLDLIPHELTFGLGHVLTFGAHKYGDRNWEAGMRWGRVYAALQRHLTLFWSGELADPETGMPHLAHAAACVAFLMAYENRNIGEDDRPSTKENPTPILREFEPETVTDDAQQAFWQMTGMGGGEATNVVPAPVPAPAAAGILEHGRTLFEGWAADNRVSAGLWLTQHEGTKVPGHWTDADFQAVGAYMADQQAKGY